MMRWGALVAFTLCLLVAGLLGAVLVALGCDENLHPDTARSDVCTTVGEVGSFGWWALACAPALLFFVGALVSGRGKRLGVWTIGILVALVALDATLLAVVTSNLLA
jgi:hypothetical protein